MKFNILAEAAWTIDKQFIRCSWNQTVEQCLESGCDTFECTETMQRFSRQDLEGMLVK